MSSSNWKVSRSQVLSLILIAILTIASRAPFLLQAGAFFDADEAVEGLMARHVPEGEYPAFMWGQRYKGVPEVYVASALFAFAGASVRALKAATLIAFVVFVCLQFVLVERWHSRTTAWISTLFLLASPPVFVLWSLSASAEVVMTLLAGTTMYLAFDAWRRSASRRALALGCAATGFGLWVQQYIVYYLLAYGIAVLWSRPDRASLMRRIATGQDLPRAASWLLCVVGALAAVYVALGTLPFIGLGFDVTIGPVYIGVNNPQKLWTIGAGLLVLWGLLRGVMHLVVNATRATRGSAAVGTIAFLAAYAPALFSGARGSAVRISHAEAGDLLTRLYRDGPDVLRILTGLIGNGLAPLGVAGWLVIAPAIALVFAALDLRRRRTTLAFHLIPVVTTGIFLASGAFRDVQSYRYVMPMYGALAVLYAIGVKNAFDVNRVLGGALAIALVALWGNGQQSWYRMLEPDNESEALIACLDRHGIRYASADYWVSYKLTFLTGERIIVVPDNPEQDRYPPYRARVVAQTDAPNVTDVCPGSD